MKYGEIHDTSDWEQRQQEELRDQDEHKQKNEMERQESESVTFWKSKESGRNKTRARCYKGQTGMREKQIVQLRHCFMFSTLQVAHTSQNIGTNDSCSFKLNRSDNIRKYLHGLHLLKTVTWNVFHQMFLSPSSCDLVHKSLILRKTRIHMGFTCVFFTNVLKSYGSSQLLAKTWFCFVWKHLFITSLKDLKIQAMRCLKTQISIARGTRLNLNTWPSPGVK